MMRAKLIIGAFLISTLSFNSEAAVVKTTETDDESQLSQNWKKSTDSTNAYFKKLVTSFVNSVRELKKLKVSPPAKPFPNITFIVHNISEVFRLREMLMHSELWHPHKYKLCFVEFEKNIKDLVDEYEKLMQENYNKKIDDLLNKVPQMHETMYTVAYALSNNKRTNLVHCAQDEFCSLANRHLDKFEKSVEHLEKALDKKGNYFDSVYDVEKSVAWDVTRTICYPVRICLQAHTMQ